MKNPGDVLIDDIIRTGLSPHEKLLCVVLARRLDWKTGKVRMKRETLMERTGLSLGQIKRAISGAVEKGFLDRQITGRSSFFKFRRLNREIERVGGSLVDRQTVHQRTIEPEPDPDCIPEYEADKLERERLWPHREGVPDADGLAAMGEMTRCLYIEAVYAGKIIPFPFVRREHLKQPEAMPVLGPDPEDLSEEQWAMHRQRASELLGVV